VYTSHFSKKNIIKSFVVVVKASSMCQTAEVFSIQWSQHFSSWIKPNNRNFKRNIHVTNFSHQREMWLIMNWWACGSHRVELWVLSIRC